MISDLYPPDREAPKEPEEEGKPFDITEYGEVADSIAEAAQDLSITINDLRVLLGGDDLAKGTTQIRDAAREITESATETAEASARAVIDHAFLRSIQFLVAAFGLAILYGVIGRFWLRKPTA